MNENISKALREAQRQPVLVRHGDKPAVWMVSADDVARVASTVPDGDVYRHVLEVVAVRLFEEGTLTMMQAARFLSIPLDDFIDLSDRLGVPILSATGRTVAEQVDAFEEWLSAAEPA